MSLSAEFRDDSGGMQDPIKRDARDRRSMYSAAAQATRERERESLGRAPRLCWTADGCVCVNLYRLLENAILLGKYVIFVCGYGCLWCIIFFSGWLCTR